MKQNNEHYIELELIKTTDPNKILQDQVIKYWAVDSDTADSMMSVDYSRMTGFLSGIEVEYLGNIQVQTNENQ